MHAARQPRSWLIFDVGQNMNALLKAIADGWSWKLGTPVALVATNRFGNAIVTNADGHFFRIVPEEWQCELLARSAEELESIRRSDDFRRDWEMTALVEKAEAALGPLVEGQTYYLVVPGILGGKYAVDNIRKILLCELLAYCGEMAQQIDDVPDGESVVIVPTEKTPNKAPEPTPGAVTPRATSGTSR